MNINRNNYEELYLLYVDGELSAQEKLAVEQFVEDNPDTAHELIMLMQTRLDTDNTVFNDKDSLYKIASDKLNPINYEDQFLLYVDDELNDDDKKNVETFVLQNPQFRQEFTLLKRTKLVPENIVFPDKASLYKKEKRPIIYFSWTRLAIAAALIGFLFLVWTVIPVKNTHTNQIIATKNEAVKPIENTNAINNSSVAVQNNNEKKQDAGLKQIKPSTKTEHNIIAAKNVIETKKPLKESGDENIIAQIKTIAPTNINTDMIIASANPLSNNNTGIASNEEKNLVQQTVYKELNTEQDERRNNIYIGNMEVNKDKLLGFFKRASHVFSKSKDDDGKVAIANFSLDTKSLK